MRSKSSFAAFAAVALVAAVAAGTTLAQQPRPSRSIAAPLAADQTLGVAIMSALLDGDANLVAGVGAVTSAYDGGAKTYTVKFNRTLAGCVSSATPWYDQVIASSSLAGDTAFVFLWNLDGSPATVPFQLIVFCSK
jgi:hypothetical protein